MNDKIKQTQAYLRTAMGETMVIKPITIHQKRQLPTLLTESYGLYFFQWMDVTVCLMVCKDANATPIRMKKHCEMLQNVLNMHAAVVLSEIKSYNLQRMVEARVNFIVPGRQLYLPSLWIDLRQPRKIINMEGQVMPVMAQCMLLYHLEKKSLNGQSAQPISELMGVSYPNISRAIKWLNENHLVTLSPGREKQLTFVKEGYELWQQALPLLQNPCERVMHTDLQMDAPMAGEEALAEESMLAEPAYHCWAISKEQARKLSNVLNKEYGEHRVEVWRYDPALLSNETDKVDQLSLYLTLRNTQDERVHKELNQLMKEIKW